MKKREIGQFLLKKRAGFLSFPVVLISKRYVPFLFLGNSLVELPKILLRNENVEESAR